MSYKKRNKVSDEVRQVVFPKYTKAELVEFETWLEKFRVNKTLDNGVEVKYIDTREAMVDFGALSKHVQKLGKDEWNKEPYEAVTYQIILEDKVIDNYGSVESYKQPTKQDLFEDKFDQLQKMRFRDQFIDVKQTEAYEKMAEEKTITSSPMADDVPW
jgi:hypothetical protein